MSQQQQAREHYKKQRRQPYHQQNLQGQDTKGETAEILTTLSKNEDLPIEPQDDEVMGQLISELTSTANLTPEQVRSNEWVREYILILYLSKFPTPEGCHTSWRGWSHGDSSEAREPMQPEERMKWETLVSTSKLALSRSEGAKVIEEGTRNVSESIVNEENDESSSGGILGKLRG